MPNCFQTLRILTPAHLQRLVFGRCRAQGIELALLRVDGLAHLRHLPFQPGVAFQPLAVLTVELHQVVVFGGQRFVGLAQCDLQFLHLVLVPVICSRWSLTELREQITASTNKVEAYNGFAKYFFFGGEGVIADNDPVEQEKAVKYNDLVSNAVIFYNVVEQTRIMKSLMRQGWKITREDVACLSPYVTSHVKRFGDYLIDVEAVPEPYETELALAG